MQRQRHRCSRTICISTPCQHNEFKLQQVPRCKCLHSKIRSHETLIPKPYFRFVDTPTSSYNTWTKCDDVLGCCKITCHIHSGGFRKVELRFAFDKKICTFARKRKRRARKQHSHFQFFSETIHNDRSPQFASKNACDSEKGGDETCEKKNNNNSSSFGECVNGGGVSRLNQEMCDDGKFVFAENIPYLDIFFIRFS